MAGEKRAYTLTISDDDGKTAVCIMKFEANIEGIGSLLGVLVNQARQSEAMVGVIDAEGLGHTRADK